MHIDLLHANNYLGSLFYTLIILLIDGISESSMTIMRLEGLYKQRDFYFFPAWAFAIPASILKIPLSLFQAVVWTSLTYFVIGYSPDAGRLVANDMLTCVACSVFLVEHKFVYLIFKPNAPYVLLRKMYSTSYFCITKHSFSQVFPTNDIGVCYALDFDIFIPFLGICLPESSWICHSW